MKLKETNTAEVAAELTKIRGSAGSETVGRVLTLLIVVPTEKAADEAIATAGVTSRAHPCRIVVIVHAEPSAASGEDRLDAEIRVGGRVGASEVVILRPRGHASEQLDTLVTPLLLSDTPIVVWWPEKGPDSPGEHPLGQMADRRITDVRTSADPVDALERLALNYRPGDTDLSWSAVTLWRALAVTLVQERPHASYHSATVRGDLDHPATHLIAGWIALQLDVPVELESNNEAETVTRLEMHREDGDLTIDRPTGSTVATLSHPSRVDQRVNLARRSLADCLTEELRRLDPDEMYARVITRGIAKVER